MKIEGLLLQKPPQKKLAFMFLGTYLERKFNMARLSAVGEGGSNRYLTKCIARHLKTVFPIEHRSRAMLIKNSTTCLIFHVHASATLLHKERGISNGVLGILSCSQSPS